MYFTRLHILWNCILIDYSVHISRGPWVNQPSKRPEWHLVVVNLFFKRPAGKEYNGLCSVSYSISPILQGVWTRFDLLWRPQRPTKWGLQSMSNWIQTPWMCLIHELKLDVMSDYKLNLLIITKVKSTKIRYIRS